MTENNIWLLDQYKWVEVGRTLYELRKWLGDAELTAVHTGPLFNVGYEQMRKATLDKLAQLLVEHDEHSPEGLSAKGLREAALALQKSEPYSSG